MSTNQIPSPGRCSAGGVSLLTELVMAGDQPGGAEHHLAKQRGAETCPRADHQCHHHQPQPVPAQPRRQSPTAVTGETRLGARRRPAQLPSVKIPAERPVLLRNFARRVSERPQRKHDKISVSSRHPLHDRGDLHPSTPAHLRNQVRTGTRQRDPNRSTVVLGAAADDQMLAHQPFTHPRRRRAINPERNG